MSLVGVDCGGTNLAFGVFESPLRRVSDGSVTTPESAEAIPRVIVEAVTPCLGAASAIGIGVAGLVDHKAGVLRWMPHRSQTDVPIGPEVASKTGLPVVVANDADLAALAEARLGAGRGHRMVLMVTLGTGIGGGLVVEEQIERGRGYLGEIGHMILDASGPGCPCGGRGCWEAFVSGRVLTGLAAEMAVEEPAGAVAGAAAGSAPDGRHLLAAAEAGDPAALLAVGRVGDRLGMGLANLVAAVDPDVIVVGGAAAIDLLLEPARRSLRRHLSGAAHRDATPVMPAQFGAEAGLVGAAIVAEEESS